MRTLFLLMQSVQKFLWGIPMLLLLLGTHMYFTVKLHFIQRKLPLGIRWSVLPEKEAGTGGISPFSALATALAATIGTGNIIGISTAIAIGGPGAIFWCWITGVLGIATCYAECYLSVRFRVQKADGSYTGGPMYVMEHALHQKSAAIVFALAVVLVSFGMGSCVQSHSIAAAVNEHWTIDPKVIGILLGGLVGIVILGGVDKITKVCTWLVPFMSCFFLGGCLFLVWKNRDVFLETIRLIVTSAFSARSAAGGVAGVTVMTGLRIGVARGLFTSEAGLGSIPISAAAAQTKSAYRQSLVSMTGVFWDTVVMCAVTGIAIIGCMIKEPARYLQAADDRLCFLAFENLPFRGSEMLSVSLVLFAFATIIGWSYYGERAVEYLGKGRGIRLYRILYIGSVLIGTILPLEAVWEMSDLFNSLMVLPNVFCLWMLKRYVEWKE